VTKRDEIWNITIEVLCETGLASIREIARFMLYEKLQNGEVSRKNLDQVTERGVVYPKTEPHSDVPRSMYHPEVEEELEREFGYDISDLRSELDFAIEHIEALPSKNTIRRTVQVMDEMEWIEQREENLVEKKWVPSDRALKYLNLNDRAHKEGLMNRIPSHFSLNDMAEMVQKDPERVQAILKINSRDIEVFEEALKSELTRREFERFYPEEIGEEDEEEDEEDPEMTRGYDLN
jgi:hypothetical protein